MRKLVFLLIIVLCSNAFGAEFLIYNKTHWIHTLTPEQHAEKRAKYENWNEKVAGQYIPGDIIEVRQDGFWTGEKARGFNRKAFRVLSVPGLSLKTAQSYKIKTPTKKSRFNISTGEGWEIAVIGDIKDLNITDKEFISAMSNKAIFDFVLMLSIVI